MRSEGAFRFMPFGCRVGKLFHRKKRAEGKLSLLGFVVNFASLVLQKRVQKEIEDRKGFGKNQIAVNEPPLKSLKKNNLFFVEGHFVVHNPTFIKLIAFCNKSKALIKRKNLGLSM